MVTYSVKMFCLCNNFAGTMHAYINSRLQFMHPFVMYPSYKAVDDLKLYI